MGKMEDAQKNKGSFQVIQVSLNSQYIQIYLYFSVEGQDSAKCIQRLLLQLHLWPNSFLCLF